MTENNLTKKELIKELEKLQSGYKGCMDLDVTDADMAYRHAYGVAISMAEKLPEEKNNCDIKIIKVGKSNKRCFSILRNSDDESFEIYIINNYLNLEAGTNINYKRNTEFDLEMYKNAIYKIEIEDVKTCTSFAKSVMSFLTKSEMIEVINYLNINGGKNK